MATILVIDDERMICDLLRSVFCSHGHEVLTATSGREGLELFRQRKPRFTLLDLQMPEMDGIETLQRILTMDSQARVIMLTGAGSDSAEMKARGMGVTDFMRKGLPLEVLVRTVDKAMQRQAKDTPTSITQAPPTIAPLEEAPVGGGEEEGSILVVDDEPQIRHMVSKFLTSRGYRVRVASDGQMALAMVAQERPQFIIADMYMPGINGLELVRELRARKYDGGILALSGSQEENLLQGMLDLGAVDVMGKPVDLERLELAVQVGCILTVA